MIEETNVGDCDARVDRLVAALTGRGPSEIVDFGHWWSVARQHAYTSGLWAAAYLMMGGCSDDGFIDFRSWLVLRGQTAYYAALANPEALADVDLKEHEEPSCECYPDTAAYKAATGQDAKAYFAAVEVKYGRFTHGALAGDDWNFDDPDEMRRRLPKLFGLYGNAD